MKAWTGMLGSSKRTGMAGMESTRKGWTGSKEGSDAAQ